MRLALPQLVLELSDPRVLRSKLLLQFFYGLSIRAGAGEDPCKRENAAVKDFHRDTTNPNPPFQIDLKSSTDMVLFPKPGSAISTRPAESKPRKTTKCALP